MLPVHISLVPVASTPRRGGAQPGSPRWSRPLGATESQAIFAHCRLPSPVPIPVPTRRRRLAAPALSLALALASLGASAARAGHEAPFEYLADGRLVDVQVRVEDRTAPLYFAPGRFDRRYFQAFKGRDYSLVVRNRTGRRVGVLIAVDGLNVVNGQRSGLSHREAMYVLDPHERAVIRGWRTSLDDVRKFVFVDEERSYAERTGQANGDLGWIRVLAFRESGPWWREEGKVRDWQPERSPYGALPEGDRSLLAPQAEKSLPAPEPGRADAPGLDEGLGKRAPGESRLHAEGRLESRESSPGTGWGERRRDPVSRTRFEAQRNAVDHIVLRYEYARGLRALGIDTRWGRDRLWERERGQLGFAQPPRW